MEKKCIKLSDIKEGRTAKVESVVCCDDAKSRLCSLGVLKGKEIEMIKNDKSGPILVKVLDSKIAIGRKQAMNIYICSSEGDS